MVLERGEPGEHFAVNPKRRHAIRNALLRFGYYREDAAPQRLKRRALRLWYAREIVVDLFGGHLLPSGQNGSNHSKRNHVVADFEQPNLETLAGKHAVAQRSTTTYKQTEHRAHQCTGANAQ